MMAKSKAQEALFEVAILVKTVERLKRSGEMVFISWKRGKLSGTTKTTLSKDLRADWQDELITIECAFTRAEGQLNVMKENFSEKTILLIVNEETDKKTRKLGRVEIDLAKYAQQAAEKSVTSFTLAEPVSRDLIGDEDAKKDKKDKKDKTSAPEAMKLLLTLNFANKSPNNDAVTKASGHKVSRSVDIGPLKLRKQQSSPILMSNEIFNAPSPQLVSSDPRYEKSEKKEKKHKKSELRESSEQSSEKKEKKEKKDKSHSGSRGDESDTEKKERRERSDSRGDGIEKKERRATSKAELGVEEMRTAKQSLAVPNSPVHPSSPLAASPTPNSLLATPPRRMGHRKTSSMSVAMLNSSIALDSTPMPLRSPKRGGVGAFADMENVDTVRLQIEEDEGYLIENVIYFMDPTYSHGWPLPSYIIFRSLLQWRAFDAHTHILSHINEAIEKVAQKSHVSQAYQAFWLASVSTLAYLFKKELQLSSSAGAAAELKDFDTRLMQSCTHLFMTLLKACYAELDPILSIAFLEQPDPMQQATQTKKPSASPETVIAVLNKYLDILSQAHLFKALIVQFFRQILYYINGKLFNALVEGRGLCRCGNGIQIKMGVSVLQEWTHRQPALESLRDQLESIRQSADVLVLPKSKLLEGGVRREVCPALSGAQLHALLSNYEPDDLDPEPISAQVLQGLAQLAENSVGLANINVNYLYPLSLSELSVRKDFDFGSIEVPQSILAQPGFAFLKDNSRLADAGVTW